jgi:aarF domain-containing kinase
MIDLELTRKKPKLLSRVWSVVNHFVRLLELLVIFAPVFLLYPLRWFRLTREFWINCFVSSVERAGVVWIKVFQSLSHRRDIIGEEMSEKFVHLREKAPQHSFEETKKSFNKLYGKKILEVFDEFDEKPLASGSVSQVHRAVYHGQKVAVKVRHPDVQKYIEPDLNLLFFVSHLLSFFSKSFWLPVSQDSIKQTLMEQTNFLNEKENLITFNRMFKGNKTIKFPRPFSEGSNEAFLV